MVMRALSIEPDEVYLIEKQGPSACLHRTPRQLFELDA